MKSITTLIVCLCFYLNINAQYYSVEYKVNPVTLCNSSEITSVTWKIKSQVQSKVIIQSQKLDGSWNHIVTKTTDAYGNLKYKSAGLKINSYCTYRFYVYPVNSKVNRFDLLDYQFRKKSVYVTKICD